MNEFKLTEWFKSRKLIVALIGTVASVTSLLIWKYAHLEMGWKEVLFIVNGAMVPLYGWAGVEGVKDIVANILQMKTSLQSYIAGLQQSGGAPMAPPSIVKKP